MVDSSGQAGTLTVMTPVRRGALRVLFRVLDELQEDNGSLDALGNQDDPESGRTHFARFVVLTDLPDEPPRYASAPLASPRLFFTASFDGPLATYYADLLRSMKSGRQPWADRVWGCCEGFPGSASTAAFATYLGSHRVLPTKFIAAYGNSTVRQVRQALATQERLRSFAVRHQFTGAKDLQDAFLAEFAPVNGDES